MIDIHLDEYDMYDEDDGPPDVTCQRCGKHGLFWQKMYVDGEEKPVLFEHRKFGNMKHVCEQRKDVSNHFEDQ